MDGNLHVCQQYALTYEGKPCCAASTRVQLAVKGVIIPLQLAPVWLCLGYCVQVWSPWFKTNTETLEVVESPLLEIVNAWFDGILDNLA